MSYSSFIFKFSVPTDLYSNSNMYVSMSILYFPIPFPLFVLASPNLTYYICFYIRSDFYITSNMYFSCLLYLLCLLFLSFSCISVNFPKPHLFYLLLCQNLSLFNLQYVVFMFFCFCIFLFLYLCQRP